MLIHIRYNTFFSYIIERVDANSPCIILLHWANQRNEKEGLYYRISEWNFSEWITGPRIVVTRRMLKYSLGNVGRIWPSRSINEMDRCASTFRTVPQKESHEISLRFLRIRVKQLRCLKFSIFLFPSVYRLLTIIISRWENFYDSRLFEKKQAFPLLGKIQISIEGRRVN